MDGVNITLPRLHRKAKASYVIRAVNEHGKDEAEVGFVIHNLPIIAKMAAVGKVREWVGEVSRPECLI